MVDLVKQPPHQGKGVCAAMPDIAYQRHHGVAERGATDHAETFEIDQAVGLQPVLGNQ